ncbi:MAG: LysR substrate-binding domain-containing protein [Corynebacterium sp.]|uniref:LysR family transcriptional regulator n=1 Tax=Corynebacterium sp. TaxID=1720 RepID=UPI0026DF1152|nr:LysR substrate-binding domain-containing protein [Corynebacterium sp.]MDO5670242.1 LysR substrate-binding domain-containing protein [Corynebacterium sp.]
MEFRQIRYFLMVAEELNFTRAAERLHMAQPPLSQQIKALESELGFSLFSRTTRIVELTPAGRYLYERLPGIFDQTTRVVAEARDISTGARGVVRIGFVGSASYDVLIDVVKYLRHALPDIRVHVETELLTPHIEERLRRRELDLGIIRPPVTGEDTVLELLRKDPFVLAMPEDHPLSIDSGPIDMADLRDCDFVSYPANAAAAISLFAAAKKAGFMPRVAHQADKTSTLLTLVGAGAGIAAVPEGALDGARSEVVSRPLTGIEPIGLAVCTRRGSRNPIVKQISEAIRRAIVE